MALTPGVRSGVAAHVGTILFLGHRLPCAMACPAAGEVGPLCSPCKCSPVGGVHNHLYCAPQVPPRKCFSHTQAWREPAVMAGGVCPENVVILLRLL